MNNKIVLDVQGVCQSYGDHKVLHDVNLRVVKGQFVAVVGASGCGKSTLLRSILGVEIPKKGCVFLDGKKITCPNRDVGIVFQKYGLYEFLTVEKNAALGLKLDQTTIPGRLFGLFNWLKLKKQHLKEARELLIKLNLGNSFKQYPSNLSGGMQQRVAIAQALLMKPKMLLLDEPFGALDEATREDLQKMLLTFYAENLKALELGLEPPYTILLVTHELNEAFYCCDRVVGLSKNWTENTFDKPGGHVITNSGKLGATKVYDKAAPVYCPGDVRNYQYFETLIGELRQVVFEKDAVVPRRKHVSFWSDLSKNVGTGVCFAAKSCKDKL